MFFFFLSFLNHESEHYVFLQETLNEFDSVPDRGPVVPAEQSGKSWIVKSGAVISDRGEFSNVVQVNRSSKTTLRPAAFFEAQNLYTKYTFLRLWTS